MDEAERELVAIRAVGDRAWADLRQFQRDIERIARGGVHPTARDNDIVRKVFKVVAGDLEFRSAESKGDR